MGDLGDKYSEPYSESFSVHSKKEKNSGRYKRQNYTTGRAAWTVSEIPKRICGTREEFVSDLKALFNSLEGLELIDAVIARIQRDAAEHLNLSVDGDFRGITVEDLGYIREVIRDQLRQFISYFILDEHREFMVHCHARGISTTDAVTDLISENSVLL